MSNSTPNNLSWRDAFYKIEMKIWCSLVHLIKTEYTEGKFSQSKVKSNALNYTIKAFIYVKDKTKRILHNLANILASFFAFGSK